MPLVWSTDKNTPCEASLLLYGDRMFSIKDRDATLSCYAPSTGEAIYGTQRLEDMGMIYASLVGNKDRTYISDLTESTLCGQKLGKL